MTHTFIDPEGNREFLEDRPYGEATAVVIPGVFMARYLDGRITGFFFMPAASDAGYQGDAAAVADGDIDLDVEESDGPFWKAVQRYIGPRDGNISVTWEE